MNDQPPEFIQNQGDNTENNARLDDNPPEPVSSDDYNEPVFYLAQQQSFNEQSFDPVSSSYSSVTPLVGTSSSNFVHNQNNRDDIPDMNTEPPREPSFNSVMHDSSLDLPLPSCSNSIVSPLTTLEHTEFGIDIPHEPSQGDELVSSTTSHNYQKPSDFQAFISSQNDSSYQNAVTFDKRAEQPTLETGTSAGSVAAISPKNQSSSMHPSDPTKFHIDNALLAQVLDYGFSSYIATLAIQRTRGAGVEQAVNWIIDHSNASDIEVVYEEEQTEDQQMGSTLAKPASDIAETSSSSARNPLEKSMFSTLRPMRHKMIFVANMGLKMGVGKLAAQVGHATLGVYRAAYRAKQGRDALEDWRNHGEVKIVVKGQSTEQLLDLFKQSKDAGLHAYLVQDAGYTQIPPGSRTILAIFGPIESVDQITGSLKLL